MVTIYLDKQVFSHLFKAKEEKYILLREKILSHKDEFIFFYSNGHLFDLQDDKTDIKYDEMKFMQSVVDGNRLIYEDSKQIVVKQSPCDVFETIGRLDDYSWLENFDYSKITEEQRIAINNIVDISMKDLRGELDFDWLTTRTPIVVDEPLMDMSAFTSLLKFISSNFYENKTSYKIVRDNTIAKYNPTSITAEDENVFNDQLAASPLGLSFLDMVKAVLTQTGLPSTDLAIVYYMSYMLLDLYGINKECRKKVKFRNMQADCAHSFFGSYCDCIVSDDEGMRRKSKTLYKLFNWGTKVYSIDEFIEKLDEAIINNKKTACECFQEVLGDYHVKQAKRTESTPERTITYFDTTNKYLGYFNCMVGVESKDAKIIFLHKNNDFDHTILMKEIEIIVNRVVRIFNEMGGDFALFDEVVELPLLKEDNWNRMLILNDADVGLTKFKNTPMLCLWIKFKNPIS